MSRRAGLLLSGLLAAWAVAALGASEGQEPPAALIKQASTTAGITHQDPWLLVMVPIVNDDRPHALRSQQARGKAREQLISAWLSHHFPTETSALGDLLPWLPGILDLRFTVRDLQPAAQSRSVLLALDLRRHPADLLGQHSIAALCRAANPQQQPLAAEALLRLDSSDLSLRWRLLHGSLLSEAPHPTLRHLQALRQLRSEADDEDPQAPFHARAYATALLQARAAAEAEQVIAILEQLPSWPQPWAYHGHWAGLAAQAEGDEDDSAARWLQRARDLHEHDPVRALLAIRRALALGAEPRAGRKLAHNLCVLLELPHAAASYARQP